MLRYQAQDVKGRFGRFVVVGSLAAAVNLAARYLFSLRLDFEYAVALAFPFGLLTAYILNRLMVFEPSGRSVRWEFGWFLAINLAALVQVWVISVGLARFVFPALDMNFYPLEVAHVIGVAAPIATSYLAHKYLTFRRATE